MCIYSLSIGFIPINRNSVKSIAIHINFCEDIVGAVNTKKSCCRPYFKNSDCQAYSNRSSWGSLVGHIKSSANEL